MAGLAAGPRRGRRLTAAYARARGPLKLTCDSLPAHLAQRLLPAYLVSGDEPLLAGEAADAVRARARSAGFSEREVHFIERSGDWDALRASAASLSLFAARRVLEIRLASARPGVAGNAALTALLGQAAPDLLLLILAPRLDREAQGAEWVRALDQHGAWVQVWPVDPARLSAWLRGRCPCPRARAERGGARAARGAHRGQPARRAPGAQQAGAARGQPRGDTRGGARERRRQRALRRVSARRQHARRGRGARTAHARRTAR